MSDIVNTLSALGGIACIFLALYYTYMQQYDAAILYLLFACIGCGRIKE